MPTQSALAAAKAWMLTHPEVTEVYWGHKNGDPKQGESIVFAVREKKPIELLSVHEVIPRTIERVQTDVVEQDMPKALNVNTGRRRPCPGGFSMGHVAITAGTFGCPVKRGVSEDWLALTNNHVAANSNDARLGDAVVQPGKADGGTDPSDRWGTLLEFVTISFEGQTPGKKNSAVAQAWWASIKGIGNFGAWVARCPYRVHVRTMAIPQPSPNLVDAAVVKPLSQDFVLPEVYQIGEVMGIRDLQLGEEVFKNGRTTGRTTGRVLGTNGMIRVSYGGSRVAVFDDQIISDIGSAGGDSGSAILTADRFVGGLLFAGGGGQTICNKISHVVALLGVRV
jgi:hypothetical protein